MLKGNIRPVGQYTKEETDCMYALMAEFYDNTSEEVFRRDFSDKDYCLALYNESDTLVGFTTQKVMEIEVDERKVHGVFSGDTIIHKEYWGDLELFKIWALFWFDYAKKYEEFYWFLICKGYKTYRMLPLFFNEFYPNYRMKTPEYEKKITDAYAEKLYGKEYNPKTGVIEYCGVKDSLKQGVADVGEKEMKNRDIEFFCHANPDYIRGNDLACIAKLDKGMLRKHAEKVLFR